MNANKVEYLLIGGVAVAQYGYSRFTYNLDVWVGVDSENATRLLQVLRQFGFATPNVNEELLMRENRIIRMGLPPVRIEVHTGISGVRFQECYKNRQYVEIDGNPISIISLRDLRINKAASGRHQDLADLEHLPTE